MKKITALVLSVVLILSLAACGGSTKARDIDINTMAEKLVSGIEYDDELSLMEDYLFAYLYGDVTIEDVDSFVIYISSGATAEEVACFKAIDESAAQSIETGLKSHIEDQIESFTDYVPAEVKRLEDAVLVREGQYVILSVSGSPEEAKKIINE